MSRIPRNGTERNTTRLLGSENGLYAAVSKPTMMNPAESFSTSQVPFPPALPSFTQPQPYTSWCHPSGIGPGKHVVTVPFAVAPTPACSVMKLNWNQDPHLIDLSCAGMDPTMLSLVYFISCLFYLIFFFAYIITRHHFALLFHFILHIHHWTSPHCT